MYRQFLRHICVGTVSLAALASAHAQSQKKVIADFEDFGTWRMRDDAGVKPQVWWPAEICLSGSDAAKGRDNLVGELKFAFAGNRPYKVGFDRAKMTQPSGFLDGIEWEAEANDLPVALRFYVQDSTGKIFTTKATPLTGKGWQHYRQELNAETLPGFADIQFPARIKRVILEASKPCEGRVFLDDLAITGRFTKKDRLTATPIYEKISSLPTEDITLRYRIRNAQPEAVSGTLKIDIKDFNGKKLLTKEAPFKVDATGSTEVSYPVGKFPLGAYEVALTIKSKDLELQDQDQFVVMIPNNGQPNKHPMWFGICDQTSWQGDLENRRHWEWMHTLGIDINRLDFFPNRFELTEGVLNEPGWDRMFEGLADAGVDALILYSGTPPWTHTKYKPRASPDLWPQFEDHARHLAKYFKKHKNITYLEFWNEPDLDFFEGTMDEYVAMFEHFSKGFKEVYPELTFTTGGVTVAHPKEKPNFSKDIYTRTKDLYDVAAYHSHGPLVNSEVRQQQVEKWLKDASLENRRIINTETGDRSLYAPEGRRRQAITLVKKIVYSKSRPNFDAYFWFTLQDYWDMDIEADDSFGLVTSDNRAKPSFAAYNTLIRTLANTTPVADGPQVSDLKLYAFRRDDGSYVYAGWPLETKSSAILWLQTSQKVNVSDIFGVTREFAPLGNILPVPIGELPLYISGSTVGETIKALPAGQEFLTVDAEIRYSGATASVTIPVKFRNPTKDVLKGALVLKDSDGNEVAKHPFETPAGQVTTWSPSVAPAKLPKGGALQLDLLVGDAKEAAFSFPVKLIETYRIAKTPALGEDPTKWPSLDAAPTLTLDKAEQVFEMAYDPTTPAWKGAQDLSAIARMTHDEKGIRFQVAVTDDVASPVQEKDQMFRGDDVQVAFGGPDAKKFAILDLGVSKEGPTVWCSESVDPKDLGQWKVPFKVTKNGSVTTYDVYLPFDKLGLKAADQNIRFSFLVNENDGKGRIRWIELTPGIARDRGIGSLGHASLD